MIQTSFCVCSSSVNRRGSMGIEIQGCVNITKCLSSIVQPIHTMTFQPGTFWKRWRAFLSEWAKQAVVTLVLPGLEHEEWMLAILLHVRLATISPLLRSCSPWLPTSVWYRWIELFQIRRRALDTLGMTSNLMIRKKACEPFRSLSGIPHTSASRLKLPRATASFSATLVMYICDAACAWDKLHDPPQSCEDLCELEHANRAPRDVEKIRRMIRDSGC